MVQGKWFSPGSDIAVPVAVRQRVFGRGKDALDDQSWLITVYREDAAVGSGRLWWADGRFQMGDVGVLEEERNRGYGDLLVRLLLYKALTHNAGVIALSAPESVAPFFARYGFIRETADGATVGMSIQGKDVCLSHCGGNCAQCNHPSPECAPKALR